MFQITKLVLKNLFSRPATAMYPFKPRQFYQNTRGKIEINREQCTYCTLCQKKCPTGAITVDRAAKQWEIDRLKCITCNYCVEACARKCLSMDNVYSSPVSSRS